LGFIAPFPTDEDMNKLYERDYGSYIPTKQSKIGQLVKHYIGEFRFYNYFKNRNIFVEWAARLFAILIELVTGKQTSYTVGIPLQLERTDNILEIGYGTGDWLHWMRSLGFENLYGYDISDFNASRLHQAGVKTFTGNISELAKTNIKFNLVRLQHVFEHVPDPAGFLHNLNNILQPGGRIVVVVPNLMSLSFKLFKLHYAHLAIPHHLFHYPPQSLGRLFMKSGYSVEAIKTLGQSSIFLSSLASFLRAKGFVMSARIVDSRISSYLLSPAAGLLGFFGLGDEVTLVAAKPS
jgi:2-polyprenyl-3-methyl-5-hydroxy-6-metoxy-1,4-benzoquinol methylase